MQKKPESRRGITRRMFTTASATTLGVAGSLGAASADAQEREKPADIPTLKYDLEAQTHWIGAGGSAKEATVAEFPVSQSIAGVSMRLDPGAIRELHWHALAAEWAYMLEGRCRATVIAPNGQSEIAEFGPGDTWYFPRGHGHALQGLGPGQAHFLLVFDNGHFSEFGTFSVTDWIAQTKPEIAARILNLPVSELGRLPKKELYIGPGVVPGTVIEELRNPELQPMQFSHKYRLDQAPGKFFDGGSEHIVSAKEFPIQTSLTAVKMHLNPGALREMHWHPHADEWQYYIRGKARMTVFGSHGRTRSEEYGPGHVGFVPQGYGHYVEQVGNEPTEILILFNHPEFQEISLSGWLGGNPSSLLTTNFGISKDAIDRLPKKEQGILGRQA
jgi:oxalate decarboxylase